MTQNEMVLKYMKDFGSITTLDAMRDLGVYRLSARIADLRAMGHEITSQSETGLNRYNKSISYARYSLTKGQE